MGEKIGLALFGFAFGAVLIYAGVTNQGIEDIFSLRGSIIGNIIDNIALIILGIALIIACIGFCIREFI